MRRQMTNVRRHAEPCLDCCSIAAAHLLLSAATSRRAAKRLPPDTLAAQEEAAIRAAVARVADSVVQIRTIGGLDEVDRTLLADGPTTGLVISADGWIVSSAFNFVQQPASILVTFASGEQAPAELVANDHSRMLVLLKAQGRQRSAGAGIRTDRRKFASVSGRSPSVARFAPIAPNISVGIVSALDRMFGKVIQTDADVSTANYGGPLVDIRGRVLGVIVPIAPQSASEVAGAEWYDSGIGFAVPLAAMGPSLERMKAGKDQYAGVLGIGLAARESAFCAGRACHRAAHFAGRQGRTPQRATDRRNRRPADPHADRSALRARPALRRRRGSRHGRPRRRKTGANAHAGRRAGAVSSTRSWASCRCAETPIRQKTPTTMMPRRYRKPRKSQPPASSCAWSIRVVPPPRSESNPETNWCGSTMRK